MIRLPNLCPPSQHAYNLHLKTFVPLVGINLIFEGTHHQCSCQASNPFNLNLHDHPNPIPSFTPNPPTLTWAGVSTLNVLRSFHLGFHYLQLYNFILITLQCDVQVTFCFPLNKLHMTLMMWQLVICFYPNSVLFCPFEGGPLGIRKRTPNSSAF
jgi:hypothetical protein